MSHRREPKVFDLTDREIVIIDDLSNYHSRTQDFMKEIPTQEGAFALQLIERWGMVAGKDGGEDSQGRHKLALMEPEEVVDRALLTAHIAFRKMQEQGTIQKCPSWAERSEDDEPTEESE